MLPSFILAVFLPALAYGSDPQTDAKINHAVKAIMSQFKLELNKVADQSAREAYNAQLKTGHSLQKRDPEMSYPDLRRKFMLMNNNYMAQYYPSAYGIVYNGAYGLDDRYYRTGFRGPRYDDFYERIYRQRNGFEFHDKRSDADFDPVAANTEIMKLKLDAAWKQVVTGNKLQKRNPPPPSVIIEEVAASAPKAAAAAAEALGSKGAAAASSGADAAAAKAAAAANGETSAAANPKPRKWYNPFSWFNRAPKEAPAAAPKEVPAGSKAPKEGSTNAQPKQPTFRQNFATFFKQKIVIVSTVVLGTIAIGYIIAGLLKPAVPDAAIGDAAFDSDLGTDSRVALARSSDFAPEA